MSALDNQVKTVRAAIAIYDAARFGQQLEANGPLGHAEYWDKQVMLFARNVVGETEALLTILDQQREPI